MIDVEALIAEILEDAKDPQEAVAEIATVLNDLIYSSSIAPDGGLVTWREQAKKLEERVTSYVPYHRFVDDLDRCQHGRHEKDPCFNCPGGTSNGNMWMNDLEKRPDHDPKRGAQLGLGHTIGGAYTYFLRRRPKDGGPPVAMTRVVKGEKDPTVLIRELESHDETEQL